MNIKCIVACHTADGFPTFFACIVECDESEAEVNRHYALATAEALKFGYTGPLVVFDEDDGHDFLFEQFFGAAEESEDEGEDPEDMSVPDRDGDGIPLQVRDLLWDAVTSFEERATRNGRTALYEHLLATIHKHLKTE